MRRHPYPGTRQCAEFKDGKIGQTEPANQSAASISRRPTWSNWRRRQRALVFSSGAEPSSLLRKLDPMFGRIGEPIATDTRLRVTYSLKLPIGFLGFSFTESVISDKAAATSHNRTRHWRRIIKLTFKERPADHRCQRAVPRALTIPFPSSSLKLQVHATAALVSTLMQSCGFRLRVR